MPDSGSQADDLNERVGSDEFIGSRMAQGHDSDVYSSLDRTGENGDHGTGSTERLVRPSQMKKNKQGKSFSIDSKCRTSFFSINILMTNYRENWIIIAN